MWLFRHHYMWHLDISHMLTGVVMEAKFGVQKELLIQPIFFTTPARVMNPLNLGRRPQLASALGRRLCYSLSMPQ